MRSNNLLSKRRKRYVNTTQSCKGRPESPNILKRDFNVSTPNTHWVSDITYIKTNGNWLYLAVIIDLYSRAVVGWAMDKQMSTQLILDALKNAVNDRAPCKGLIFHSDRGSQYTSDAFLTELSRLGIRSSMSRVGNCWDNTVAESFFSTLKTELALRCNNMGFQKTKEKVIDYIESFYNNIRLHSSNEYMPPFVFEKAA